MNNAVVDDTGLVRLQATESEQSKAAQDQMIEELLQAPLTEESFDRLLSLLEERQRAGLVGEIVFESANQQLGDVPVSEPLVQVTDRHAS
jgi:hypothetical protein